MPISDPEEHHPSYYEARDGLMTRICTPGGFLTSAQALLLAQVADEFAGGKLSITSRANVLVRALHAPLPGNVVELLRDADLISARPEVDHLRNIMASPTAGLDPGAVLDTGPLVSALDAYLMAHPELGVLPMKFSIGLDGGERASIAGQPNDVLFRAYRRDGAPAFRVLTRMGHDADVQVDLGIALRPAQVVPLVAAIAARYVEALPRDGSQPHLHHLLDGVTAGNFRETLAARVPDLDVAPAPDLPVTAPPPPIGIYPQASLVGSGSQMYLGTAPFIGALGSIQFRDLAGLARRYGSDTLRLSPWRNVILPDVVPSNVDALQAALEASGLLTRPESVGAAIVACAGRVGCSEGLVDTMRDARALNARLAGRMLRDRARSDQPPSVHFAGCEKCCAQRRPAGVTFLGRPGDTETYDVYVSTGPTGGTARLGQLMLAGVPAGAIIDVGERIVADGVYSLDR